MQPQHLLVNKRMNTLYKSTKVLPYVYFCKEKTSNKFYIGYRYTNKVPSTEDFGVHYFTSNEYVKNNFDNFECHIVAEFFDKQSAYEFESFMISSTKCVDQINYIKILERPTTYSSFDATLLEDKKCALPECGKIHSNWRSLCCCIAHSRKYAGLKRHLLV